MRTIDANVILRYLTNDLPEQARRADKYEISPNVYGKPDCIDHWR